MALRLMTRLPLFPFNIQYLRLLGKSAANPIKRRIVFLIVFLDTKSHRQHHSFYTEINGTDIFFFFRFNQNEYEINKTTWRRRRRRHLDKDFHTVISMWKK